MALLPALAVAGCAQFSRNSPFWGTLRAGVEGGVDKPEPISREYTDKLPYASMLAWFDGSPPALIVLAEATPDGRWVWNSAQRQAVIGFGPLIVGMLGFDIDLRGTRLNGSWDRNMLRHVGRSLTRVLDVAAEGDRVQVPLRSQFRRGGTEDVEILGVSYRLDVVHERVSAEGRHRFTNRYWVNPEDGRCWKSVQTVIPTLPKFHTEVLKYPNV